MHRDRKIALVIPAYNEEKLIQSTLANLPAVLDLIYVVDDKSPDRQAEVVEACARKDGRIRLLRHAENQGPGGAIITGYCAALEAGCDIAVVVGGDFQMDLAEINRFLDPIIDGKCDYTKGNRFLVGQIDDTLAKMPRLRFVANWIITGLTKFASGYYRIADVVDGYTAISRDAIQTINWKKAWKRYGYPMDFLVRLNAYGFRVLDVRRKAIYLPGERQSQIKGVKYAVQVSPMLLRDFFWRLHFRYLYRDFHPLVFFYYLAFALLPMGVLLGGWLVYDWWFSGGYGVTASRAVLDALLLISGVQFLLFAMFFDMEEGRT